jgi:hypothetical protein
LSENTARASAQLAQLKPSPELKHFPHAIPAAADAKKHVFASTVPRGSIRVTGSFCT